MATRVKLPSAQSGDQADKDQADKDQDQEATTNADRLSEARRLLAENDDANQKATLVDGGGVMPSTASGFVPAEAAGLPPAAQGEIAAQAGAMASLLRANQVAARFRSNVANLDDQGVEETPSSTVEPQRFGGLPKIVCPNCGRSWDYQMNMAGSLIPCSGCHQMVNVPYPSQMRESVPDAEATEDSREAMAKAFPAPEKPALDPEKEAEAREDADKANEGGEQ